MDEEKNIVPGNSGKRNYLLGIISGVVLVLALNFAYSAFLPQTNIFDIGGNTPKTDSTANKNSGSADQKIDEIFKILDTYYVGEYDKEDLKQNMFQGLVYGVGDPYTSYMDKDTFEKYMTSIDGNYSGIGITVTNDTETNSIVIISLFEGYPGQKAGLLPGDRIVKVNGKDVSGEIMDEAISIIKGEPDTHVSISVFRPSDNTTKDYDLVRENISVPTVSHKMLENDIGYLRITQFDKVTLDQFKQAYADLQNSNMKGLIIDLRNNPGGLLNVVCSITDMLVPKSVITYTEDKNGKRENYNSGDDRIEIPLLLLVNGGSASASEVMSGAVQDLGVGELVGTKTFGKGLVQNIFECKDGSAVKVTIAKYYTPRGVCIHGIGIEPDYVVEMSDELSVKISSLTMDEDVQLKKAFDIMSEKIK